MPKRQRRYIVTYMDEADLTRPPMSWSCMADNKWHAERQFYADSSRSYRCVTLKVERDKAADSTAA